ncbi:MAG: VOC family protein [Zhengella sp.]|uniref:VOC family protein n=1 Tax=Zhengella sp. TaxID=2282762 RepID=UPI001D7EB438|nr:VOC family protein [Notoacmeibacter sp.]MCC0027706.1 VOC family protein [Brucellaceae bacterium]
MTDITASPEATAIPAPVNGQVCWFEIPVTDLERARTFYETALATTMRRDDTGPNPMIAFTSMDDPVASGHLYPGKPSAPGTGSTIHLVALDPLETVMARIPAAGGQVVSPVIPIPAGRFFYATDPDGNSVGFFNFTS